MGEKYIPNPIDTSDVQLPEKLIGLTELIAENVHEVWAAGRITEGWSYGEERDTELKITPCLVPYENLSEEEKNYDRMTAMETLKVIYKLGYEITPVEKGKMSRLDYWHERHSIPETTKKELKELIKGEFVEFLYPQKYKPVALLKVTSEIFNKTFAINRCFLYRGDYTAPPEENDYGDDECFLTEDGLAGFCITEKNWLISLYSNQPWRGFLNMVSPLLERVTKLVCIVNETNYELVNAYKAVLGFKEIARTVDDTEIMTEYYGVGFIENFVRNYGRPHHVFLYRPKDDNERVDIRVFEDYFEAEAYVDREVR